MSASRFFNDFEDLKELNELAALLEVESAGKPVDRDQMAQLAQRVAEKHPAIRKTMGIVCERMIDGRNSVAA